MLNVTAWTPPENTDRVLLEAVYEARRRANEFTGLSVWMREDGDDDVIFEHQFVMVLPNREQPMPSAPFQFSAGSQLQRFRLLMQGVPLLDESCMVYIESHVRRPDTGQLWRQQYPIICNVQRLQEQAVEQKRDEQAV